MIVRKGRNMLWCDKDGNEIIISINNWETPFGIEQFLKKRILNLKVPNNNEGYNVKMIIQQITEEMVKIYGIIPNSPLKNRGEELLRMEIDNKYNLLDTNERPLKVSGTLQFKIYEYKGDCGISVIIKE